MKLARRTVSLDEKIKKAEATVIALKAKYDASLDELEKLTPSLFQPFRDQLRIFLHNVIGDKRKSSFDDVDFDRYFQY